MQPAMRVQTHTQLTEQNVSIKLNTTPNSKVMLSLCFLTEHHAMKTYWGSGDIALLIL
jgi:hypothetical protein